MPSFRIGKYVQIVVIHDHVIALILKLIHPNDFNFLFRIVRF